MGADRHYEDPYPRRGIGPKLALTGQLKGTLFSRPVELEAREREVIVRIADLRSAWRLRRSATTGMLPVLRLLFAYGIALRVNIGSRLAVNVLPRPSLPLRLLLPALNLASSGEN